MWLCVCLCELVCCYCTVHRCNYAHTQRQVWGNNTALCHVCMCCQHLTTCGVISACASWMSHRSGIGDLSFSMPPKNTTNTTDIGSGLSYTPRRWMFTYSAIQFLVHRGSVFSNFTHFEFRSQNIVSWQFSQVFKERLQYQNRTRTKFLHWMSGLF